MPPHASVSIPGESILTRRNEFLRNLTWLENSIFRDGEDSFDAVIEKPGPCVIVAWQVKNMSSEARLLGFEVELHHLLAV